MELALKISEVSSKSPHIFVDVLVDGVPFDNGQKIPGQMYFNREQLKSEPPNVGMIVEAFVRNLLVENSTKTFSQQKTLVEGLKIKV